MELHEVKSLWQAFDTKLEKSLRLNQHCLEQIQAQKIKSKLNPLLWYRVIEISLHGAAILLLIGFLYRYIYELRYAASAFALLLFYIIAFLNCLKQIIIIKRMDYSNDIVTIQSSLVMLQTHILGFMRLILLCMPTLLAYPLVVSRVIIDFDLNALGFMDIQSQYPGDWWRIQLIATAGMIPFCIWLYSQISYKNIDKKWIRDFIEKSTGTRIRKAVEFTKELESLKHDAL